MRGRREADRCRPLLSHIVLDELDRELERRGLRLARYADGRAGLNEFTDEVVQRPENQAMIRRVRFDVHPEAEKAGYDEMTSSSGRADSAKGRPSDPITFAESAAKLQDCARFAEWPAAEADDLVASVSKLEEVPDVRTITTLSGA